MSDEQADAIYGRLCREITRLDREIALYEVELRRIGKDFEVTGQQLQVFRFSIDREGLEKDIASLWDIIKQYEQAVLEYANKKDQKEAMDRTA